MSRVRQRRLRSAGAVLVRYQEAEPFVLLVHRRRQDDWTLPKGRVRSGESSYMAARREVWEEAAVRCGEAKRLIKVTWRDRRRRTRRIRYWLLTPLEQHELVPTSEIAAAAWMSPAEAKALVSSRRDRQALRRAIAEIAVGISSQGNDVGREE